MSRATGGAAAVDEVFLHAPNFCDVKVGGNDVRVRENNMEEGVRMGAKRGDESGGVEHDVWESGYGRRWIEAEGLQLGRRERWSGDCGFRGLSGRARRDWVELMTQDVEIREEPIELYKVLKIAGLAASGGEAKFLVGEGKVSVNGEVETRKRKKIGGGDEIEFGGEKLRVCLAKS